MADETKHGDLVELKSGSTTMTVEDVSQGTANCIWEDKDGTLHKKAIKIAALKKADPAKGQTDS